MSSSDAIMQNGGGSEMGHDRVCRRAHLSSPSDDDRFALKAEAFARFFGTPPFLVARTAIAPHRACRKVGSASPHGHS